MAKKITETTKKTVSKKNETVKKTSTAKKVSAVKKVTAAKTVSSKSPAKKAVKKNKTVASKTPVASKKSTAPGRVISPARALKKSEMGSVKKKAAIKAKLLGEKKNAVSGKITGKAVAAVSPAKRTMKNRAVPPTVQIICQALADKKAEDIKVFDVCGISSVTDYIIVGTGTSEPHLRALRVEIERELSKNNIDLIGSSSDTASGWLVADAFDVMAHIFTKEMRDLYRIESLFKDAQSVHVTTK